jgi:hypothetical protein
MSPLAFATMCLCRIRTDGDGSEFTESEVMAAVSSDWPAANSIEDFEDGTFPEGTVFYTSTDPASGSSKRRRDDTGFCTAAILPDGTHVILFVHSARLGLDGAKKIMAEQCERWPVKAAIVETNGGQVEWLRSMQAENLPAVEHVTGANRLDGAVGVGSLSTLFRNKKVILSSALAATDAGKKLLAEALFWEPSGHTGNVLQAWWQIHHYVMVQRRAARKVELPEVNVRIVGEPTRLAERIYAQERQAAERAAAERERAEREAPDEEPFLARLFDVPPDNDNDGRSEWDARERLRNERHAAGAPIRGGGWSFEP